MDTLCGIGLPELIILALLGFVLIGPERSQAMAVQAGRFLRTVMTSRWWQEFNQVTRALRDLPTTLVRMAELEDAQRDLQQTVQDINQAARSGSQARDWQGGAPPHIDPRSNPWGIPMPSDIPAGPNEEEQESESADEAGDA